MSGEHWRYDLLLSISVFLFVLLFAGKAVASIDEEIPLELWINRTFSQLVSGVGTEGPEVLVHTRPYTREKVAKYLHALAPDSAELEPGLRILYRRLRDEFEADIAEFRRYEVHHVLRFGAEPYALAEHTEDRRGINRAGGYMFASFGKTGRWVARCRVRLDSDATYDTRHRGIRWEERLTGNVDDAYLKGIWGSWELFWGRNFTKWGRSDHDGLLLSGFAPPLDYARIAWRRSRFHFQYFVAVLDDQFGPGGIQINRYLAGHRVDFRPWRWLELAVSEVVVFGGAEQSLEWYYLNPFLPYYWEQQNEERDDNPLWSMEFSIYPYGGWELYGELLIDDFQIDFSSEPHQIGGLAGLHITAPFGFSRSYHTVEYSRVNTSVYGQNEEENRYYYRRDRNGQVIPLGSRYGPDVDRFSYTMMYRVADWLDLGASVRRLRHGQWDIETPQPGPVPYGIPFPSGIVDRRWDVSLEIDGQYRNNVFAHIEVGWSHRKNEQHIPDRHSDVLFINASLSGSLWQVFSWPW